MHDLEQKMRGIGLNMNSDKTEFMSLKSRWCDLLNCKFLELVNQFQYLDNNITSTESNVNIRIGKAWINIDQLTTIWKFDFSNDINQEFFRAIALWVLL